MKRHWLGRFGLVLLAGMVALALPCPTFAGGVAVVLDRPLPEVEAGRPTRVGFLVRSAHADRTLIPGLTPAVLLTNPATNERLTATAHAEGAPGHYVASLTIPAAGEWRWQIHPFGLNDLEGVSIQHPLQVRAAGVPASVRQPAAATARVDVKTGDSFFEPLDVTVVAGTTVHWENGGQLPHTVTASDGQFASGYLETGASFEYTFTEPGTYHYYCEYHAPRPQAVHDTLVVVSAPHRSAGGGGGQAMVGSITVTAPTPRADVGTEQAAALLPMGTLGVSALGLVVLGGTILGLVVHRRARRGH